MPFRDCVRNILSKTREGDEEKEQEEIKQCRRELKETELKRQKKNRNTKKKIVLFIDTLFWRLRHKNAGRKFLF